MHTVSSLLAAAAVFAGVQASPFDMLGGSALKARAVDTNYCKDFVYGNTNTVLGQICVTITNDLVTIKYPTLTGGKVYTDLHAWVTDGPINDPAQNNWPLTLKKGQCTTTNGGADATCSTPTLPAWLVCGKTLNVAAHASFGIPGGAGDSGWGSGNCIPGGRPQNCAKSFSVVVECKCTAVTTYSPYSTEVVYTVTKVVYETKTNTCTTSKDPVTTQTTCANPSAATETVDGGVPTPAGFTCATPANDFVCPTTTA